MASTGFEAKAPGAWNWPADLAQPQNRNAERDIPESNAQPAPTSPPPETETAAPQPESTQQRPRGYGPRTCRICLETVHPTYTPPTPGILGSRERVTWESEDGGRLLRPCKCKGTAKYVHEGCLQAWRHADPGYAARNFYQCPTCGYKYRLQRLGWASYITSTAAQITVSVIIVLFIVFVLGFIADPLINFALDPYGTMLPGLLSPGFSFQVFSFGDPMWYDAPAPPVRPRIIVEERSGWLEHFAKGFAGLGLMSFLKFMLSSPINFFLRQGGRRQGGRERLNTITWIMIAVGVATFLYAVWKFVRNISRRFLEKAGERVMDVPGGDDDDDEEDVNAPRA